jgi:hypothetical protein
VAIDGHLLLRRLEPPVRPVAPDAVGSPAWMSALPVEPLDAASFATLLGRARAGSIASGRLPVQRSSGEELALDAAPRIARALDMLEARGFRRAAVLYGQRLFIADVATRTLESEVLAQDGPMPLAVDAAVRVPTPDEEGPTGVPGPPTAVQVPLGVLDLLEARDSQA